MQSFGWRRVATITAHASKALRGWRLRVRWPAASLGAYWVLVIVIATVPMALYVSYLVYRETLAARTQLEEGLRRTANTFALAVERELVSSIDALSILAYAESLQRHDIARFYDLSLIHI